ncbi:MAG: VOC family protein [Myxococcota bacterium]|nr:VOC family protein [Myxococcota bacterium]
MLKVTDVSFIRFAAPDLDAMERFAAAFGLVKTERTSEALYCRGTDPEPFIHVTELGEPGFRGVAFDAASAEDLEAASQIEGASPVEPLNEPGGGQRVQLRDPDGFSVEIVHGREVLQPLAVRRGSPINTGSKPVRFGTLQRLEAGPAQVKRLGHCVLRVSDFKASAEWYQSNFGFLVSDEVYVGEPGNNLTAFMRCDRGKTYVDHHSLLCIGLGDAAFDHAAFEVEDFDAVMLGHDHLKGQGYDHHTGIGRHILGSQVYDYWKDPWGHVVEHFTDGDLLNSNAETSSVEPPIAVGTQWGSFSP